MKNKIVFSGFLVFLLSSGAVIGSERRAVREVDTRSAAKVLRERSDKHNAAREYFFSLMEDIDKSAKSFAGSILARWSKSEGQPYGDRGILLSFLDLGDQLKRFMDSDEYSLVNRFHISPDLEYSFNSGMQDIIRSIESVGRIVNLMQEEVLTKRDLQRERERYKDIFKRNLLSYGKWVGPMRARDHLKIVKPIESILKIFDRLIRLSFSD